MKWENDTCRYLILLEIAQFKCKESITFLSKINSCDKNNDMRLFAFNLLQQMGEHPWLARNRKGKTIAVAETKTEC